MSQTQNTPLAQLIGTAVATGTLVAGSLFSMQAIAQPYAGPQATTMAAEGKCGEGKCGSGEKSKRDAASGQASGKRQHKPMTMADVDSDNDGRISRAEFAAAHPGKADKFASHDTDGDGFISQAEMEAHHAKMSAEGKCGGSH